MFVGSLIPAYFLAGSAFDTLDPTSGGRPIPLDDSFNDVPVSRHDRVGLLPDDLPAGTYRLRCENGGTAIDVDGFGVRSTEGWTDAILMLIAAIVLPGIAGLTAITIVVITAVRRSSARSRGRRPPTAPYGSAGIPSAPTPMP